MHTITEHWKQTLADLLGTDQQRVSAALDRAELSFSDQLTLSQAVTADPVDTAAIRRLLIEPLQEQDNPYAGGSTRPQAMPAADTADSADGPEDLTPGTEFDLPDGRTASVSRDLGDDRVEVVLKDSQREVVRVRTQRPKPKPRGMPVAGRQRKK